MQDWTQERFNDLLERMKIYPLKFLLACDQGRKCNFVIPEEYELIEKEIKDSYERDDVLRGMIEIKSQ